VSNASHFQAVGPKASPGSPPPATGTTQDSAPPSQQQPPPPNMWVWLMPMLVVMAVMLFMNRNQRKKDAEVRSKLKKGDRVVSQSGLIGELIEMDDRLAKVKIAPGCNVQMLVSSVSPFEVATAKDDTKQLKDLKDAKATADKK
jgi:preprotein translocase subunit YajC